MRLRHALLVLPALLAPLYACEDSSSSSSGGIFDPDSGPGFDAGAPPEGGSLVDAPDAAPPKGMTLTVLKTGAPRADVRVIAHDATGAVTSEGKTDAAGKVTLASAPSMVTVLGESYGSRVAVTYLGVADGDALVVSEPTIETGEIPPIGTYSVSLNPYAGATNYEVYVGAGQTCSNSTGELAGPVDVLLFPACVGPQNAILARAAGNEGLSAFAFAKNVAKPPQGATVAVGPLTFTAKGTVTLTATGFPADLSKRGDLWALANGSLYYPAAPLGSLDTTGQAYPYPVGFADAIQSTVRAHRDGKGLDVGSGFVRREAPPAGATATIAYDFADALPFFTGSTVDAAVPARANITLQSEKPLTATDGGIVRIDWTVGGSGLERRQWLFVVPPTTTSFKVPALPADAEAAAYAPGPNVVVSDAIFVEATQLTGYGQLKALPISMDLRTAVLDPSRPLPSNGVVRITSMRPALD